MPPAFQEPACRSRLCLRKRSCLPLTHYLCGSPCFGEVGLCCGGCRTRLGIWRRHRPKGLEEGSSGISPGWALGSEVRPRDCCRAGEVSLRWAQGTSPSPGKGEKVCTALRNWGNSVNSRSCRNSRFSCQDIL